MKMKKSTKTLLILSAVFISLGTLLTVGSMMFGTNPLQAIRNGALDVPLYENRTTEFSTEGRYTIPANGIQNMSIDWLAGDITIEPYDGTDIVLEETSSNAFNENNSLDYTIRTNELQISYGPTKAGLVWSNSGLDTSKELHILLPHTVKLSELGIDSTSSNISIQGISPHELEVDTVSGNLDVANAVMTDLSFDSTSGSVAITDSNVQEIEADTVTGNLDAAVMVCPMEFSFNTTSGDATLTLPPDSQFRLTLNTATGQINSDFQGVYRGNTYIVGTGFGEFEVDSVSGSVNIHQVASSSPFGPAF